MPSCFLSDYKTPQAHRKVLPVENPPEMGDDKIPPRLRTTQAEKNKNLASTIKEVEMKEELLKNKKKEAMSNKENKENKKEEKKISKENETIVRTIITKMEKNNVEKQEANLIIMKELTQSMANAVNLEMKNLIIDLTDKVVIAIKDGIKESNNEKNNQIDDNPLATQTIITEIQRINKRLENNQTNEETKPEEIEPEKEKNKKPQKIPNIYSAITKDELVKTINNIIDHINNIEQTDTTTSTPTPKTRQKTNKPVFLPAINLDVNDDPTLPEQQRTENQPLDWTRVKTAWKTLPERPPIPEQIQKEVKKDLKNHVKDQQEKNITTQPQQQMEEETREDKVREMLRKQTLVVGFAPITSSHLEAIESKMIERGAMNRNQPKEIRRQRTIKSVIKSWAFKNLKLNEESWDSIQLEEIVQTQSEGSDIIFLKCKEDKDAQIITQNAKNLPQDPDGGGPRLVSFIDRRAKARHRAYLQVAKTLRENASKPIQTNIRTGRNDFLLRMREKGDLTPWSQIPPLKVNQKLPHFEVGLFKTIEEMSYTDSEPDNEPESMEEEEELNRVQRDLEKDQSESAKKRNRNSDEDSETNHTKFRSTPHPRGRTYKPALPESTSDSSDDDKYEKPPPPQSTKQDISPRDSSQGEAKTSQPNCQRNSYTYKIKVFHKDGS